MALRSLCALMTLVATLACSRDDGSAPASHLPPDPFLQFTVVGAGFDTESFGPRLADVTGHWVYEPGTGQTRIHLSGVQGPWRVGIDFLVPASGPGTRAADTSYRGMDRSFSVWLSDHATRRHVALIGVDAELTLAPNDDDPSSLSGSFTGRFAVGARTTGRDVLGVPPEERSYAEIRDGRFRVRWKDTLNGAGERWPAPPRS